MTDDRFLNSSTPTKEPFSKSLCLYRRNWLNYNKFSEGCKIVLDTESIKENQTKIGNNWKEHTFPLIEVKNFTRLIYTTLKLLFINLTLKQHDLTIADLCAG